MEVESSFWDRDGPICRRTKLIRAIQRPLLARNSNYKVMLNLLWSEGNFTFLQLAHDLQHSIHKELVAKSKPQQENQIINITKHHKTYLQRRTSNTSLSMFERRIAKGPILASDSDPLHMCWSVWWTNHTSGYNKLMASKTTATQCQHLITLSCLVVGYQWFLTAESNAF